ncbi:MAG: glutathione S-transferase N-terminal domain-containing protein [Deltaproteobacteria bacterium]|nr:glutathione S-transferase N-terminal domain-containing protein [Deltaproteobacteria bacterium]
MAADANPSESAQDLTLFHYSGCFYCERVRGALEDLGLTLAERNIVENADAKREIVEARGRKTVPVLRIEEEGGYRYMGESRDIVRYLYERFGDGEAPSRVGSGDLDFWMRIAMWAFLGAGGLYADGRLVLWSLAMTIAGGRSLSFAWRSGVIAYFLIGGVFIVGAVATVVEGLGLSSFEWWWLAFVLLPLLALPAVRRRRRVS